MTDILTPTKGLAQQTVGGNDDEWGDILNSTIRLIDSALGATLDRIITADVTLTHVEVQNTGYHFRGSLSGLTTVIFPAYFGLAVIRNSADKPVACGIAGGRFVTVPTHGVTAIWSDGTDFTDINQFLTVGGGLQGLDAPPGSGADGGSLLNIAGAGDGAGAGGWASMAGGVGGDSGAGGPLYLVAGNGGTVGGNVYLEGGDAQQVGDGGTIWITSGRAKGPGHRAGNVQITLYSSQGGATPGDFRLDLGGGGLFITGISSSDTNRADTFWLNNGVLIQSGKTLAANSGLLPLGGGALTGSLTVTPRLSVGTTEDATLMTGTGQFGNITIGPDPASPNSSLIRQTVDLRTIKIVTKDASITSGGISILSGTAVTSYSGTVLVSSGSSGNNTGGITLASGAATNNSGSATLKTGTAGGASGDLTMYSGSSTGASNASGDVYLFSGDATGATSTSGNITIQTGTATSTRGTIKLDASSVLIGTSTNSGYKLDVVGTGRFSGAVTVPTQAPGDAGTSAASTAFVAAALAQSNSNIGRNLLHNSMFSTQQRGGGPFTTGGYTLDRWFMTYSGDTMSVAPLVCSDADRAQIGDESAQYGLVNAFVGNAGAGSFSLLIQYTENVRRLAGKTITVSFWAKATAGTPKLGLSVDQGFGTGGSPSASVQGVGQSVTISTTWTRYSLTFTTASVAGKTLGTNNNHNTALIFWYSCGSSLAVRSGSVPVQSGTIALWGVQLEIGSAATPLEKPDPQVDLANCQRFYYSFTGNMTTAAYADYPGQNHYMQIFFPVTMRATPTLSGQTYSSAVNTSGFGGWQFTNPNKTEYFITASAIGVMSIIVLTLNASADL